MKKGFQSQMRSPTFSHIHIYKKLIRFNFKLKCKF